jgi:hypothetical protein
MKATQALVVEVIGLYIFYGRKKANQVSTPDYYLYNGDVEKLRVSTFKALYDLAKSDPVPNYDLSVL